VPGNLTPYSFRDVTFSPHSFALNETSTPWLFFDDSAHSFILSPASNFLVAKMVGDGKTLIGAGLNARLQGVPSGLSQESVLTFGDGIRKTWDVWGAALRARYKRKLPDQRTDPLLAKFGYWTDNGADYYYNYDLSRGYANTLLDLKKRYDEEGIPLGYLQLDSWWYQKTIDDPSGRPGGQFKNSKLPAGSWNRYGGLYEYTAHPDLFPKGLSSFQNALHLPFAVHNRWIDRKSPYHQQFKISGVGAVDPRWWDQITSYLRSSGVACYEQDWLDNIYANSPEMARKAGVADAFADGMADACKKKGLTMQYCMATPRFFLQGLKYDNLTTIRTSDDRFDRGKWPNFLYTSQLADSIGALPWADVFKSGELGNLILSVLSAGPVGTGDLIGAENKANIFLAIRPDGVLVKPDHPATPTDQTYLDEAKGNDHAFVATTSTDRGGLKTAYVFAFTRKKEAQTAVLRASDLSVEPRAYLYNLLDHKGAFVDLSQPLEQTIKGGEFGYWMIAPISKSGIVLLGDLSKLVPTGKQRLESVEDQRDSLRVHVSMAPGEKTVRISGVCLQKPTVAGAAKLIDWDANGGMFTVETSGPAFSLTPGSK
jgi:hypothetical protein